MIIVQTCTFIDNYPYTGYNQCNKLSLKRKENDSMEKSKKMKKWIIIIVALLTILVIAFLVIKGIREDRAHKQLLEDI